MLLHCSVIFKLLAYEIIHGESNMYCWKITQKTPYCHGKLGKKSGEKLERISWGKKGIGNEWVGANLKGRMDGSRLPQSEMTRERSEWRESDNCISSSFRGILGTLRSSNSLRESSPDWEFSPHCTLRWMRWVDEGKNEKKWRCIRILEEMFENR